MNIGITSDSTCDLSPALVEEYQIGIIPLTVMKDGEPFKDGLEITQKDIFAYTASTGKLCSTAAVSEFEYTEQFGKYLKKYDALIHITISAEFSSCYQNACNAAASFENVYVVDSRNLSTGQGHIVIEAAQLAAQGLAPQEICERLRELTGRVEASFLLDRLDYMAKGGRCSSVAALGANLLKLKPCIEVIDGRMKVVRKYRGAYDHCIEAYVADRVAGRGDDLRHDRMFITHAGAEPGTVAAAKKTVAENGRFDHVYETDAGCTVSCHCGPHTLGVLFIRTK